MRRHLPLLLLVLGVARGATADDAEVLVHQALEANPTLESLQQRVDALQSRTLQAGARPEPMVGVEYSNMPVTAPVPGNHAMSGLQLRLQQTLLFPGTVPRRVAAAESRVRIGEASYEEGRVALAAAVRRAYLQLSLSRQLRSVTEAHLAELDRLIEAVRAGYEVGQAGQHDLLNLQLLRDRLDDDLRDYERTERELLAALTASVHADAPLVVPTPQRTEAPPTPGSLEELFERARAANPSLDRLNATESAELAAADAARREAWPDMTVWAGYRVRAAVGDADDGINQASVGLSVPLPTASARRYGGRQSEHQALARAARSSVHSTEADIRADLDGSVARWQRAQGKADTYRGQLIPDARTTLDATLSAYQVGRADYATLFHAQVQLLDLERALRVAEAGAALAEVDVAELLGTAERSPKGEER